MDGCIQTVIQNSVPKSQAYLKVNRAITLKIGTPGILDTFYFAEYETTGGLLKPDDVQIQVKASALDFRDVMAALGKVPFESIRKDCAGGITAVGENVSDLAVGDRVCVLAISAFVTVVRCAASYVVRIPETTDFDDATSLPITCTTVYYSLVNLAALSKGRTILIHATINLLALSYKKPALMKDLLLKSIDLHSKGVFRPVSPITTFPFSKMETAFRTMQSGDSIEKIVLRPQPEDYVKVL